MRDIYFEYNYAKLYEKVENAKVVEWKYDGNEGQILHLFMMRKIPIDVDKKEWFDIITPYGYGGPLITKINEGYTKEQLVTAFSDSFGEFCFQNNIVSEFVRFHPLIDNGIDFKEVYNSTLDRFTRGTNLKDYSDPYMDEFSKDARKVIKKAISLGISWNVTLSPSSIDSFIKVYYSTMDRNEASDYYYFDKQYFEDCLRFFPNNILLVEVNLEDKIIAAGFYFVYQNTIHAHLSGTLSEYLYLSPAYVIKYATMLWGKENQIDVIHYGGGRTPLEDDGLYKFKSKFGKHTKFPYYLGKKVWNEEMYKKLCEKNKIKEDTNYFPLYRAN